MDEVDDTVRRAFLDELRLLGAMPPGPRTERVLAAFGRVPRARFAGPGPWTLISPLHFDRTVRTPDDDPRHLYHCVLIAVDGAKGINIGEPSMWARALARADLPPDGRVLQVGAGSGYYSAILAALCGSVLGFEIEPALARRAQAATAGSDDIRIRSGSAVDDLREADGPFDAIVAFAGVTHPPRAWLDRLSPGGRMLLPVTGSRGWGAMAILAPTDDGVLEGRTLGGVGFYDCAGARDARMAARLDDLFSDRGRLDDWQFRAVGRAGRWRLEGL